MEKLIFLETIESSKLSQFVNGIYILYDKYIVDSWNLLLFK